MGIFALVSARVGLKGGQVQPPTGQPFSPVIPRTWDDEAMATLEVPLADPVGLIFHRRTESLDRFLKNALKEAPCGQSTYLGLRFCFSRSLA